MDIFFKNYKTVDINNERFQERLVRLQEHLLKFCTIEELPDGWKCTPVAQNQPGYVVTPETVLSVMKNLGI